jgi:hypothetical protein
MVWGDVLIEDVLIENVLIVDTFIVDGEYFLSRVFCGERYILDGVGFGELPLDEFSIFLELDFLVLKF